MRFLIISHVIHSKEMETYYGYGPYVREINLWLKYVDNVEILAPLKMLNPDTIDLAYHHPDIEFTNIPTISIQSFSNAVITILNLPSMLYKMQRAMRQSDHIHLRCPGNIGLLGCFVQIFFPSKKKTAKYAGNWDPYAKQPKLYRLQKWILSNTFLTRNMTVLAYGEWPNQSKNVKSFFTATYTERDKEEVCKEFDQPFKAMFVGTMGENKRPFETILIIHSLRKKGVNIQLDMYGEGAQSSRIKEYIHSNNLESQIMVHGNQPAEVVREAYKKSHFLILLSQSEGWPKVVAEAMFWGLIPISTSVSCVPWMLGHGDKGILLDDWSEEEIISLSRKFKNSNQLRDMSVRAKNWSRQFTLDSFENAIKELL